MGIKELEQELVKTGEKMGEIMAKVTPEKKAILRKIKDAVVEFSNEMEEKGKFIDKSSMYATAIILDEELDPDENLVNAAKAYIEADYQYLEALKEEAAEAK